MWGLAVVFIIVSFYIYIDEANKRKIKAENEKKRNEENEKRVKIFNEKKEMAAKLLNDSTFIKLYNEVNRRNKEFVDNINSPNNVYDCYPYSSFTVGTENIIGSYFIMKVEGGLKIDVKNSILKYKDLGIERISKEKAEYIAFAFGLAEGYIYGGTTRVKIDGVYWNATNSVDDIERKYFS